MHPSHPRSQDTVKEMCCKEARWGGSCVLPLEAILWPPSSGTAAPRRSRACTARVKTTPVQLWTWQSTWLTMERDTDVWPAAKWSLSPWRHQSDWTLSLPRLPWILMWAPTPWELVRRQVWVVSAERPTLLQSWSGSSGARCCLQASKCSAAAATVASWPGAGWLLTSSHAMMEMSTHARPTMIWEKLLTPSLWPLHVSHH